MPRIDRQTVEELSQQTGFQMDVLEKSYRLTELLKEIIGTTDLADILILKGGTAINFIYFDVPRLSVDIDMDYTGSVEKSRMEEDRSAIEGVLLRLFRTLDYDTREESSYALQHYDLWYENSAGNRDRVELEINLLKRVAFFPSVGRRFRHFFGFAQFEVPTLKPEELFGRKLKALIKRATAKDLFDIYYFLKSGIQFDMDEMRKSFIFSLCLDGDPRDITADILDEISPHDVKANLLPMLRKGEKVGLETMKEAVFTLAEDFLSFTRDERAFIEMLFDRKEYKPELLFKGMGYNKLIIEHPGIMWRLKQLE